jgi:isopenicillin-N epimerase
LGKNLNADADDLVYIPNVTFGINIIARSLHLETGDQILASDHEYSACVNIWSFITGKKGVEYVQQSLPLPLNSPEYMADQFWDGVTSKAKVIFLSHITSPTAQQLPVALICKQARQAGILSVIDGAHAPGQITIDFARIDPDFYVGNCHN